MKRVLILSTRYKIWRKPSAKEAPNILSDLANALKSDYFETETGLIEDLTFRIIDNQSSIELNHNNRDIAEYDLVYIKYWGSLGDIVDAIGIYLNSKSVRFICSEVSSFRLENKISEGFLISANGMNYPDTVFSINRSQLLKHAEHFFGYPLILKAIDGQKGDDNYLVHNEDAFNTLIEDIDDKKLLMAQEMIPNDRDYRIFCIGGEPELIIERSAKGTSTHLNNASKGAKVKSIKLSDFNSEAIHNARDLCNIAKREIAGVDIIFNKNTGEYYILEINLSPQITTGTYVEEKSIKMSEYFKKLLKQPNSINYAQKKQVGVSTYINLYGYKSFKNIPVRIDTGARTSSLWASDINIIGDEVKFKIFGPGSRYYTGKYVKMPFVEHRTVTSSTGHEQERIVVKFPIKIKGKKILTKFTLSDRSTQIYPVLIGRNTLRGHFLVDSSDPGEAAIYKYPEEKKEFKEVEE